MTGYIIPKSCRYLAVHMKQYWYWFFHNIQYQSRLHSRIVSRSQSIQIDLLIISFIAFFLQNKFNLLLTFRFFIMLGLHFSKYLLITLLASFYQSSLAAEIGQEVCVTGVSIILVYIWYCVWCYFYILINVTWCVLVVVIHWTISKVCDG